MRGVIVTFEAIRGWCLKFGQTYANELRRRRPRPGDRWHLDEVFIRINGRTHYLWRAVHQEGEVLDILVQSRRDKKAAKRYCQLNGNLPCDTATECDLGPRCPRSSGREGAHLVKLTIPSHSFTKMASEP